MHSAVLGICSRIRAGKCTVAIVASHCRFLVRGARRSSTMGSIGENGVVRRVDDIVKSQEDKRSYRGLELTNGMKVLLVSDPTTDKSAASLDVNVGYMSDPDDVPGLAHFCEHMLFLGTEKYPQENAYSKFLSEHGGSSNACTFPDHTNYYFSVVPEQLGGALDRFAQFFLAPLFTEAATERELNAVHSEHEKNVPNDMWRLDQLDKHMADTDHPYHKFGTGSRQTLDEEPRRRGLNVRDLLLSFHERWYSADVMALAVLGREPLDELQRITIDLFGQVRSRGVCAPSWPQPPFSRLRTCTYVVPIKDIRNLSIVFPTPDLRHLYRSMPENYVSHLVGHEGAGSLLSALKARGWCSSLVGGNRPAPRGFGFFGISVDLTEEGIQHVDDIVALVFQYLNMLRAQGPQLWLHQECRDIGNMNFRFKEKCSPCQYISGLVHNLHHYPLQDVLSAHYLLTEWRPDLVQQLLDGFTPDNIRVAVLGKRFADRATQVEPWYGTQYLLEQLPDDRIEKWKNAGLCDELRLPDRNEFIPTDFELLPLDKEVTRHPVIVQDTPLYRLWFKQDDEFLLPKNIIMLDLVSPLAYLDPLNCNLTHMFVQLFKDALNEYAYAAETAGLRWNFTSTKYGLIVCITGYSSKQHILLDKVMDKLTNFRPDPKRFDILKENYVRSLKNFAMEQPYQHAVYYLAVLLTEHSWTHEELLEATSQLSLERLERFIPQMLSKLHVECLVHGNCTRDKAQQLMGLVEARLAAAFAMTPLLPRQLLLNRELRLDNGSSHLYRLHNGVHRSSCVELYYQCGVQEQHANMLLELFTQLIHEPCFDVLRTKEQLGYIVFSGVRRSNGIQGLRFIVQSDRHPALLDRRVERFLARMRRYVRDMSDDQFQRHKDTVAASRLERPKQLRELTAQFWAEITSQQYHFDRAEAEVAHLRTITKEQVLHFYEELLARGSPGRHKLAVHVLSTAEGGAGALGDDEVPAPLEEVADQATGHHDPDDQDDQDDKPTEEPPPQLIRDVTAFKSCHGMYPLAQPYINIIRKGNRCKL